MSYVLPDASVRSKFLIPTFMLRKTKQNSESHYHSTRSQYYTQRTTVISLLIIDNAFILISKRVCFLSILITLIIRSQHDSSHRRQMSTAIINFNLDYQLEWSRKAAKGYASCRLSLLKMSTNYGSSDFCCAKSAHFRASDRSLINSHH